MGASVGLQNAPAAGTALSGRTGGLETAIGQGISPLRFADGGAGLYKGAIDWFEWGAVGERIPAAGLRHTNTREFAGGTLATTCTIGAPSGGEGLIVHRPGNFSGDGLDDMYNVGGTGTSNELISGLANYAAGAPVTFDFTCDVTLDGVPVPLAGLVMADAEASLNANGEYVQATIPAGGDWRIIDRYRPAGCAMDAVVTRTGQTMRFAGSPPRSCDAFPTGVAFMEGASSAVATVTSPAGRSAIALGVVLFTDFGDAPSSYGDAGSVYSPAFSAPTVPQGQSTLFGQPLSGVGQPATRLGAAVTSEQGSQPGPAADADSDDGISPLAVVEIAPGRSYTLDDVACTGPGFVAGWIDWNGDGAFDEGERSSVVECAGGVASLSWTMPDDVLPGATFLRLRIGATAAAVGSPTGVTTAGEVEDHPVTLIELSQFSCTPDGYLFQYPAAQTGPTSIRAVDMVTGGWTEYAALEGRTVNGVAFNPLDGYMYGYDYIGDEFVRIGAEGSVVGLGLPTGWTPNRGINTGEFDDEGRLWVAAGGAGSSTLEWYSIDVAPDADFAVIDSGTQPMPVDGAVADWAFSVTEGQLYSLGRMTPATDTVLLRFDTATGTLHNEGSLGTLTAPDGVIASNGFGAVYADASGYIYGSNNQTGQIWRVDPAAGDADFFSYGPPSALNDGARCHLAPVPIDFGDAPDTFGTSLGEDGARHSIPGFDTDANSAPVMLGASIDIESDGQPTDAADGDDANGVADEDGVVFNSELGYEDPTLRTGLDPVSLQPIENTLEVEASADGYVSAWVDWNQDGAFTEDERVANAQPVTAGTNEVSFAQDVNPADISTFVRVRYSTDAASIASPTGPAPDGEVEDYRVLVERLIQPDTCTVTGVEHYAFTFSAPVDRTGSGGVGSTARYENVTVIDGLAIDMVVEVTAGTLSPTGFFRAAGDDPAWNVLSNATIRYSFYQAGTTDPIDINAVFTINDMDGTPDTTDEVSTWAADDLAAYAITQGSRVEIVESGGSVAFVGHGLNSGDPVSRFQVVLEARDSFEVNWRGSSNAGFTLDGDGDIGIEPPACQDFGDAPDAYGTSTAVNGATHTIVPDLLLGEGIDFDPDGQPTDDATGDDANRLADEDGITEPIEILPGAGSTVSVTATNGTPSAATLAGWIDLNGDGAFQDAERVVVPVPAASGTEPYDMTFPAGTTLTDTFARFRLFAGDVAAPAATGVADAGEVEDYAVTVADLPPPATCVPAEIRATERYWFFGANGAIDFGVTGTTATPFLGERTTVEGSTVVTDSAGTLQFWSNGQQVFDRNSNPMPNGTGLLGNSSATQTVAAFPALGQPGKFFIVTTSTDVGSAPNGNLTYSVVDMTLNGGLGDVTDVKNVPLGAPGTASEAITAVPNADGTGFWVLTYTNNSPNVLAYEFGANGPVSGAPVTSVMPSNHLNGYGSLAFNADYTLVAAMSAGFVAGTGGQTGTQPTVVRVLQFNAETGQLFQEYEWSLPVTAGSGGMGYNAEFSPDGRFVYATKIFGGGQLYRYDLEGAATGAEVKATEENVGSIGGIGGQIRRAPDGRMYVANHAAASLSVVDDPDSTGDPGLRTGGFSLPAGAVSQFGLPQTVTGCPPPVPSLEIEKTSTMTADSRPGDEIEYTVTATNTSEADYTSEEPAVIFDDLAGVLDDAAYNGDASAEASDGSAIADPAFVAPSFLSWTGPIAAGETVTITYTVTLAPGGDGTVRNVAWQPSTPPDPGVPPTDVPVCDARTEDGTDPVTGEVCGFAEAELPKLTITKTSDTTDLPSDGATVTYTVRVTNDGPGDFSESAPATMTDDLGEVLDDGAFGDILTPADGSSFDPDAEAVTWSGPLAAGEWVDISYTVVYDATGGDHVLLNRACVPEDDAVDPDAACDFVRIPAAALVMDKTVDPSDGTTVVAGQEVTYTLTFQNVGEAPAAVDAVDTLTDVLDDATLTSGPTADPGLTAALADDELAVTGEVPVGDTLTVTYTVTVDAFADQGDHILGNVLSNADGSCPPEGCTSTVNPIRHLTVDKAADPVDGVQSGDVVTYTVTVTNDGAADYTVDAPAIVRDDMTDVLDDATYNDDAEAEAADGALVPAPAFTTPTLAWSGALPVDGVVTITYSVTVTNLGDHDLLNSAGAVCAAPEICDPPTDVEVLLPSIVPSKSSDPVSGDGVEAGDVITYTLSFTNQGQATGDVNTTDDLSDVLDDGTVTSDPVVDAAHADSVTAVFDADAQTIEITGPLAPGETATVTYEVTIGEDGERGNNVARNVATPQVPPFEPPADCEPADCPPFVPPTTEHPVGELVMDKTVDPASGTAVDAGGQVTYTLTFSNTGEAPVTVDALDDLSDVLDDATLTAGPTAGPGLTATLAGDELSVTGELAIDAEVTVTYTVTVNAYADQGDHVLGNVLSNGDGTCPAGDCPSTENPIRHFSVSKSSTPVDAVNTGDVVTYTVTVTSDGAAGYTADTPASVSDDMSDVLDDATYNDDAIAVDSDGNALAAPSFSAPTLSWSGALAAGETATITYTVTVTNLGDHDLVNVASPVCAEGVICDPPTPPVEVLLPSITPSKSSDPESGAGVNAGEVITYTLTFTNDGQAPGPVDSTDDLSAVLDDAEVTSEPEVEGDGVTAALDLEAQEIRVTGNLAPGATATVTYQVTVLADGERGDNIAGNVLTPYVPPYEPGPDCETECDPFDPPTTQHPIGELDDWKTVDPASGTTVRAGQQVTYTLHFENTGEAAVPVNRDDVLTLVLDDAAITTAPVASDAALTVSDVVDGRFSVTGALEPEQVVTVSYTVTVNPDGQRGDDRLGNVLVGAGEEPPATCEPADGERADCTVNHVSNVVASKSSDPASGTTLPQGEPVTYTLTFENVSTNPDAAPAAIDYTDHLVDVLDDATLSGEPDSSDGAVGATLDGDTLRVAGQIASGATITVTYTVVGKAYSEQGNHTLGNVIAITGEEPVCAPGSPLCTSHELTPPPPLAVTGGDIAWTAACVGLGLLILGAGVHLITRRRRAETAAGGPARF